MINNVNNHKFRQQKTVYVQVHRIRDEVLPAREIRLHLGSPQCFAKIRMRNECQRTTYPGKEVPLSIVSIKNCLSNSPGVESKGTLEVALDTETFLIDRECLTLRAGIRCS